MKRVTSLAHAIKRLLSITLGLAALLSATIPLTNYVVDPSHLFHPGANEQQLASLLLAGQDVPLPPNYDGRLLQKDYIAGLTATPDIIVLGSSRSLQIRSRLFPGKRFFNHSLSSATLPDLIAIYELYRERGLRPAVVVIGLEPWFLNPDAHLAGRNPFESDYTSAVLRWGLPVPAGPVDPSTPSVDYGRLWSPAYFLTSLNSLIAPGSANRGSTNSLANSLIKRADGSLAYDLQTELTSSEAASEKAVNLRESAGLYVQWSTYEAADPALTKQLEAFLDELQADGLRVVLFLPPLHPAAWALQKASPDLESALFSQKYYATLAQQRNLMLLGSFDPGDVACAASEFYDGLHPREECLDRVFNGSGVNAMLDPVLERGQGHPN